MEVLKDKIEEIFQKRGQKSKMKNRDKCKKIRGTVSPKLIIEFWTAEDKGLMVKASREREREREVICKGSEKSGRLKEQTCQKQC